MNHKGVARLQKLLTIINVCLAYVSASGSIAPIEELCPYSSFCTSGPSKPLPFDGVRSCCFPCSCSDQCNAAGNCCHDKPGLSVLGPEPRCRHQSEIYSKLLNRTLTYKGPRYRVIDRCPEGMSHVSNVNDQSSSCNRADDIDDLVFVSDVKTFDVYLNRFCARCNGVEHVTSWDILTRNYQANILSLKSLEERDEYLLRKSNIISIPPTHDIGFNSVCYSGVKDRCNVTGYMVSYDPDLDELCHKYNSVYSPPNGYGHYRNIYCYLCNTNFPDTTSNVCPIIDFKVPKSGVPVFTALLGFIRRSPTAARCPETKVFDPFLDSCTYLHCPVGYLPYYGICEPMADILYGFTIEFNLELQLSVTEDNEEVIQGINLLLENLKARQCSICHIDLYEMKSGILAARVAVTSTEQCRHMRMMELAKQILSAEPLQIHLFQSNISISAYHLLERFSDNDTVRFVRRSMLKMCSKSVYFAPDTILCPTIQYQMSSLQQAGVSNSTMDILMKVSSNSSDIDFRTCVGTYTNIYDRTMAGMAPVNLFNGHCMLVVILVHLIHTRARLTCFDMHL